MRRALSLLVFCIAAALTVPAQQAPKAAAPKAAADLLDINSATTEQLSALPGIGDALSQKIIDARPFAKKDELVSKKIIPQATYDKIKGMIIAKQSARK